jgi:hypothetical protein
MKLSDFKDDEAFEVVAQLLVPISNITGNGVKKDGKTVAEYASELLKANKDDVKSIFAILNRTNAEDYHCTAASLMVDLVEMLADPELRVLFGLQSGTMASSGSASVSTEAQSA